MGSPRGSPTLPPRWVPRPADDFLPSKETVVKKTSCFSICDGVAYRLIDPKTVEREFSVLEAVPDSFPKTVLTLDRIPTKRNGIHHCYLPAWLLGQVDWRQRA